MSQAYKVLAQAVWTGALLDLYTVPASTSAIVSTIVVCETSGADTTFSISVAIAGAVDATKQYLYSSHDLKANETFALTFGIPLAATDLIRGNAAATTAFNVVGAESV